MFQITGDGECLWWPKMGREKTDSGTPSKQQHWVCRGQCRKSVFIWYGVGWCGVVDGMVWCLHTHVWTREHMQRAVSTSVTLYLISLRQGFSWNLELVATREPDDPPTSPFVPAKHLCDKHSATPCFLHHAQIQTQVLLFERQALLLPAEPSLQSHKQCFNVMLGTAVWKDAHRITVQQIRKSEEIA